MKRLISCIIFILLITNLIISSFVYAEEDSVLSVVEKMNDWQEKMLDVAEKNYDEDSVFVLEHLAMNMNNYSAVIADMKNKNSVLEGITIGSLEIKPYSENLNDGVFLNIFSGTRYLIATNKYYECRVKCYDGYMYIKYQVYNEAGESLGWQIVELAERDNSIIVVLIDYDAYYNATGRFATWIQNNEAKTIYTKTFGEIDKIVLDILAWQEGSADIISWDKSLLYKR